jgi:hypothetical protein
MKLLFRYDSPEKIKNMCSAVDWLDSFLILPYKIMTFLSRESSHYHIFTNIFFQILMISSRENGEQKKIILLQLYQGLNVIVQCCYRMHSPIIITYGSASSVLRHNRKQNSTTKCIQIRVDP